MTAHATTQLRHIHDYIAQDSPLYAKWVLDALVRKTFLLDELPRMGRKVPELNDEAVRELFLYLSWTGFANPCNVSVTRR